MYLTVRQFQDKVQEAMDHLRSSGCSTTSGPVRLDNFKEVLAAVLFPYLTVSASGRIEFPDSVLWQAIVARAATEFPGYCLTNISVRGRRSADWHFTNDPEHTAGHSLIDIKSVRTLLANSLSRFNVGATNSYIAGTIGSAGILLQDVVDRLFLSMPDLLSRAVDKSAAWTTLGDVINEVENILGVTRNQPARDFAAHLWDVYNTP